MANVAELIGAIGAGKGAKFASFTYRAKETGELAKLVIILGASTKTLYEKDVETLRFALEHLDGMDKIAAQELLESRMDSLLNGIGNNAQYTHGPDAGDTYVLPPSLPGIKIHKITGEVYVSGLVEKKTVLEAGVYKVVKSSPKTLAKNAIRKDLPSGRFRQYILRNVLRAALNGDTLEIETEPVVAE